MNDEGYNAFWPWMLSSSSNTTPSELTIRSPRSSRTDCNPFVCPGCAATTHIFNDDARVIKNGKKKIIQPRETRRCTLVRLSILIRLLFADAGWGSQ
jgi:hypothetical protein